MQINKSLGSEFEGNWHFGCLTLGAESLLKKFDINRIATLVLGLPLLGAFQNCADRGKVYDTVQSGSLSSSSQGSTQGSQNGSSSGTSSSEAGGQSGGWTGNQSSSNGGSSSSSSANSGTNSNAGSGMGALVLTALPGELEFGGMYGVGDSGNLSNPLTGAMTCPAGFFVTPVLGTSGLDHYLYFCWKTRSAGRNPAFEFGGLFGGGGSSSDQYPNPITRSSSCPVGYSTKLVHSASGLDWNLSFCYREFVARSAGALNVGVAFGGMYGYYGGMPMPNPATNASSCPSGFTTTQVYGTSGLDWPVNICWKAR